MFSPITYGLHRRDKFSDINLRTTTPAVAETSFWDKIASNPTFWSLVFRREEEDHASFMNEQFTGVSSTTFESAVI